MSEDKILNLDIKCPSCGAAMRFDPATGKLKCDYCEATLNIEKTLSSEEYRLGEAPKVDEQWNKQTQVIRCKNCGAENVVSSRTMTVTCPFCGSNQVIKVDELPGLKPNRVMPFQITEEAAKDDYLKYMKKKFFSSTKIKKYIDYKMKLGGVYMSSWTYDAETHSSYEGRLGEDYTVEVGSGEDRHIETRTRWFDVSGDIDIDFDDVLVSSGESISQSELSSIEPFDTNNSIVFQEEYLAGFTTEHYKIDVKDGYKIAKCIMKDDIERSILSRYCYDHVDYLDVSTKTSNVTYKYVLLPIWIGTYHFYKKNYRFIVNGTSGKVSGKYPVSPLKITIVSILVVALIVLAIWLFVKYHY